MNFNKVSKKIIVAVTAGILSFSPFLHASLQMQGRLIPATPYDGRILAAGVLSIPSGSQGAQNMESLFNKARTFRYAPDAKNHDRWQTPEETENRWSGDCEDKAVWLYAQLRKNGYSKARLVIGRQNPGSRGLHAWVTVDESADTFYILDPTAQKRVWRSVDFSNGSYRPIYSFDGSNRYRHDG